MKRIINEVSGWGLQDPNKSGSGGWHHAAIRVGDFIFLSGVIGIFPRTKKLPDSVEEQVRLIFQHLEAGLKAHGALLEDIVKITMYFTDRPAQWPIVDKVRRELFKTDPPTSTGVGVTALSLGAAVEIEAIAAITEKTAP